MFEREEEDKTIKETNQRIKAIAMANYEKIKRMIELGRKSQEEEIIDKMNRPDVPLDEIVPIVMGRYGLSEEYALELVKCFRNEP